MNREPHKKVKLQNIKNVYSLAQQNQNNVKRIKTDNNENRVLTFSELVQKYKTKYKSLNNQNPELILTVVYLMMYLPAEIQNHIASYLVYDRDLFLHFSSYFKITNKLLQKHGYYKYHVKKVSPGYMQIHCNKNNPECSIGHKHTFKTSKNPWYYVAYKDPAKRKLLNPYYLKIYARILDKQLEKSDIEILLKEDEGTFITANSKNEIQRWSIDEAMINKLVNKFALQATIEDYLLLKLNIIQQDSFGDKKLEEKFQNTHSRITKAAISLANNCDDKKQSPVAIN